MTPATQFRVIQRLFLTDISIALTYRGEFVLYMVSVFLTPLVPLFVWRTAIANGADLPRDIEFFTTYYVLLGVVNMLTSSWGSYFIAAGIRDGSILRWLIRPGSPHFNGIANNLSEKVVKTVFLAPMIALAWWIFRDSISVRATPGAFALFAVAVVMAAAIQFALDILVGSLAFWIDDVTAIDRGRMLLAFVLRGQLVPLALMPAWASGVLDWQPFRFTLSFPLEIITGEVTGGALALGLVLQTGWTTTIVWGAIALWRKGVRGYAAYGT